MSTFTRCTSSGPSSWASWRTQLATSEELATMSRVDVDGATRWMSVGGGLVDVLRLEDVRSTLDDGPSDLPALSAWAYRTGLSI